jgi:hypothetical protein
MDRLKQEPVSGLAGEALQAPVEAGLGAEAEMAGLGADAVLEAGRRETGDRDRHAGHSVTGGEPSRFVGKHLFR